MIEDKKEIWRTFGQLGSLGFTLVLCTFAGLGSGLLLDKWTGLKPLFTIICLLLGIIAGFVYMFYKFGINANKK
ncbi:MAG: AtpZ/AtpI family protein [bacterium]